MVTINQLVRVKRVKKPKTCKTRALGGKPQRRAVCHWVFFMDPKKPNSANRHVARVGILGTRFMRLAVFIPGGLHNVQRFSRILIRGGRDRDLPGVHYKAIRGKLDCGRTRDRKRKRSKYANVKKKKVLVIVLPYNYKLRRVPKHDKRKTKVGFY